MATAPALRAFALARDGVVTAAEAGEHGLVTTRPATTTVTASRSWHGSPVKGTLVVRRNLDESDIVVEKGLTVTTVPLSVLEGAIEGKIDVLDRALQDKRVTVDALVQTYQRRRRCRGAHEMAKMLALLGSGARSVAERSPDSPHRVRDSYWKPARIPHSADAGPTPTGRDPWR
ncbi:hypothetical protein [Gordonia terrae]|uniref:AbiEi antitoxin C-terminal domain-containing protein n=2 Tax=Gordonia terrae TaxID=2055 RepID=A0AAD0K8D3_9ACTN|nr:hypothetical protein [Gordonia terrae]ANY22738.1 hypothetical protein BCM27_07940 [Gordonia terrae]AWO83475.1 hypothetical protein DLJ61_08020 [Gordonia terrae]GAB45039.1 hypothetical protein GOTRE_078_00060 [Gordonia terrae NBRC 100016]VTR07190.1 Uncharacterised protein [Clostridioides difficile]